MEKYQNSKIYNIVSKSSDLVYYGSTYCKLSYRLSGHKSDYKSYLNGKRNYRSSYELMKLGDAQIILVEDFPCDTKKELLAREGYYIRNNECINKYVPGRRTRKEYYQNNKEEISKREGRKMTCECGRVISFKNRAKHNKTKIHQQLLSE